VSPAELQSWMRHIQQDSLDTETDKQWSEMKHEDPDVMTWDEYVQYTYKDDKGSVVIVAEMHTYHICDACLLMTKCY